MNAASDLSSLLPSNHPIKLSGFPEKLWLAAALFGVLIITNSWLEVLYNLEFCSCTESNVDVALETLAICISN